MAQKQEVVKRALISVSDKEGIVPFARQLAERGVELISTGGTYKALQEAGIAVTEVAQHTNHPEIMGGRVKTLHPTIHGGILGRRDVDAQLMDEQGIPPIDLVVVNLYPFAQTIASSKASFDTVIENIDIGGVALIRAAAKNHQSVFIVVDRADYPSVIASMDGGSNGGSDDHGLRRSLAFKAYQHTANYDTIIADWFSKQQEGGESETFPPQLSLGLQHVQTMRYGENPHQQAALYKTTGAMASAQKGNTADATQVHGTPLSFNNIADADSAWGCVSSFDDCACVIVKHTNPCGVAVAKDTLSAYQAAYKTDPVSAFGGIIAFNRPVDGKTVSNILKQQFVEVMVAPEYSDDALSALSEKPKVRALSMGERSATGDKAELVLQQIMGGVLVQEADTHRLSAKELKIVSKKQPSDAQLLDLLFAWQVAHHVKSNAIVYAKDQCTMGVGAGQMSRVISVRIAGIKAEEEGLSIKGASMASDAFFPFRDGVDLAAEHGIGAIIQPGGSMRDQEVIDAIDEHNMVMAFTGIRHFKH